MPDKEDAVVNKDGEGRSRKRKKYMWDAAPVAVVLPELSDIQKDKLAAAQKYAAAQTATFRAKQQQNFEGLSMNVYNSSLQAQQEKASIQRAVALMARLYVGSVSFELAETDLKDSFMPFGYVKAINVSWDAAANKHKGFCFIEYETVEGAQMALNTMNNALLGGRTIKVGRPNNAPQATPIMQHLGMKARDQCAMYICSIHPQLSEEDLLPMFESFGAVRSLKLAPDCEKPGYHRGYGFVCYETREAVDEAVKCLHLFDLGGQLIRVCHAMIPPQDFPIAGASTTQVTDLSGGPLPHLPTGVIPGLISPPVGRPQERGPPKSSRHSTREKQIKEGMEQTLLQQQPPSTLQREEDIRIAGSSQRYMIMQKLARKADEPKATPVVVLQNMVGHDEVDDELEGEIKMECSNYGDVKSIKIHIIPGSQEQAPKVRIFVCYAEAAECNAAIEKLDKRFFGGRVISALPYPEDKYESGELDEAVEISE